MNFSFLVNHIVELSITGLALGAIYALIALGYTMVYGVLQLINFAHSEVFMYGTFAVAWVFVFVHGTTSVNQTLGGTAGLLLLSLLAAMAMSAAIAMLLERVAYRPLLKRKAPRLMALISAIGASFALSELMGLRDRVVGWVGLRDDLDNYVSKARDVYTNPVTIQPQTVFTVGGYGVKDVDIMVIVASLLMMVALDQFVRRTRFGRGIRAVAQDPESAALMGVNATRVIRGTFILGGIMAGAAATLYMVKIGSTRQNAGFIFGVKAFTAAVLGGIGNLRGALLGGLVLGVAENYGAAIFGTQWKDVVAFVLLILILLVRPSGILGESLGKARA
ncbi:branched-chain amino acid ABC transporter permease [Phycicoccus endophyticus]|uniref:Branched-chain amino acid ABC transporter permease n=1 Tax=Phycicoccus endophyticus TaxID=1690220 RepID=A0A7G9R3D6_9MICO|nr:branched-chain amino acid ABC transporter permease [Phycicoccus endophyticus]NHI19865.1 branched-chain amino acid ABC transporter permease [Phycicoccus endophyticus]QNN50111.1 branched-chain amino acid ABC transporter permease [Phycicoccus endophyticus]GGL27928.1 branched-chain amino acid ABC transporter permease [Phycicoccus endophyticus]